jgi:hypothetical protein
VPFIFLLFVQCGIVFGASIIKNIMKRSRNEANHQSKQQWNSNKPIPEVRDDLDSRQNREKGFKDDQVNRAGERKKTWSK